MAVTRKLLLFVSLLLLLICHSSSTKATAISSSTTTSTTTLSPSSTDLSASIASINDTYLLSNYTSAPLADSTLQDYEDETKDKQPYGNAATIIIALILIGVIVGTIVGNILVCVAVCLVRKLRRPCNYLLVSLAVSDLCVAILVMPMAMIYELLGYWPFGPVLCDLWVSFDVLSCAASILNLCMISVDRYYAITKPLEYGVKRTPRRMIFCVFLVWLGAACISLPPVLILGNEREALQCIVCQNFGYQIYATLGSFYIPLLVMIVVYYKIFRAARRIVMEEKRAQSHLETHCYLEINVKNGGGAESRVLPTADRATPITSNFGVEKSLSTIGRCFSGEQRKSNESQCPMLQVGQSALQSTTPTTSNPINPQNVAKKTKRDSGGFFKSQYHQPNHVSSPHHKKLRFQLAKERKASTTLGIIMSAFIFCWLPFFVLALVKPFFSEDVIPRSLSSLFLWLGYANSLLNPIIYATLNKDFRKPFQEILYFRCSNLNHMMREEFYHSQYGDPEQHYCAVSKNHGHEESVEIVATDDRENKEKTSESFL